jgi:hypothetical protein
MEVGLMEEEGPSAPSKNPAWGSAMNGLGEGNAGAVAGFLCLGE